MGLNIKNERVHRLAREAARRTGANQTSAIETALERYLAELDADDRRVADSRSRRIDWIVADMRTRLEVATRDLDTDDLYDEHGLPT